MGRKRNPVLPIFTRDILSSPRCRALSEQAAGVYFLLLCQMNEPPQPGAFRLSDWELHPTWKRSKTSQCLATADKYERLQFFASMLTRYLPWKSGGILKGLQELYKYGIVTVEGDMLVQPRMYRDNGFKLPDLDGDGDPVNTIADDPASGSMAAIDGEDLSASGGGNKSAKTGTRKVRENAQVSPAPAHANRDRDRERDNNNKKNNGIEERGVGETAHARGSGEVGGGGNSATAAATAPKPGEEDATQFWQFWQQYDKRRIGNSWIPIDTVYAHWSALTDEERAAAMQFIPAYVAATPKKQYRKHPVNFIEERAWLSTEIVGGRVRNVGDGENAENNPAADTEAVESPTFDEFWDAYDKKVARPKCERLYAPLSAQDREAIMQYIPLYKQAQPEKRYRKNPETFLRNRSWEDEIIQANETSNRHQPNRAAGTAAAPTDREVVEQSVRIMQQLRSEAERDTDEPLL